jgi:hypothetical protein
MGIFSVRLFAIEHLLQTTFSKGFANVGDSYWIDIQSSANGFSGPSLIFNFDEPLDIF